MPNKYFSINRIIQSITHLQQYDSNWVIVPLVFAVNGVNTPTKVDTQKRAGTDKFLDKHFSGSLIGLEPFDNGTDALRPRFSEIYGNMKTLDEGDDYVYHQRTKLWANGYSSRGYREMRNKGLITGERSQFQLTDGFKPAWEQGLSADFHFEELLVWLYAFSGLDQGVDSWEALSRHFQSLYLGSGNTFDPDYLVRFKVSNDVPWPNDFLTDRPSDTDFQRALLPSQFAVPERPLIQEFNKILYGPPGVGKSFLLNEEAATATSSFRTTFHPEYSYSDFMGAFRPATELGKGKRLITYQFRPEVFLNAYVCAWRNRQDNVYLIIEEINRGNSAAIFGDVFQLLDRDSKGYSEYEIIVREEIRQYMETALQGSDYAKTIKSAYSLKFDRDLEDPYSILLLPPNFAIRATMNTSDQSLFPMDSAFKRRWSWQYVPIRYDCPDKQIVVSNSLYSWNEFLLKINGLIYEHLETEDKCIGPFFVRSNPITDQEFRDKILFYIWNDVLRNELPEIKSKAFPNKVIGNAETDSPVNFNDFFHPKLGWSYVAGVLSKLGVAPLASA